MEQNKKQKTWRPMVPAQILLGLIVLCLLLWQLPWCVAFLGGKPSHTLFTLYSPIAGEFITLENTDDAGPIRYDESGHSYTAAEVDSLLPFFYYRQLLSDQRLPDTILGHAIDLHHLQMSAVTWRLSASDVNKAEIPLYPLLESMPKRVDLEMPDDVFRVTDSGVEFVVMQTNTVDADKSQRFTKALLDKGFRFPARKVSGNPTVRKDYDEGYLMLDAEGQLFHFKMTAGRPYVKAITTTLADGTPLQLTHVFATEFRGRHVRGFLSDADHAFYAVLPNYSIVPFEGVTYDPTRDRCTLFGNMLDWTIRITTDEGDVFYANAADDLHLLRQMRRPHEAEESWQGLHFTSYDDPWVKLRW